jgi:hypothetical protein
MKRSPAKRAAVFFTFALAFPLFVMGCPKKQPPVVDAGEPPPPASSATVAELAPLTDDGGDDASDGGDGEAGKKWTGTGYNANQMKIMACCGAMRAEARKLGPSPEAFQLNAAAGQCDVFARQVGPAGNAPELNQLRQVLRSVRLPAACQF